VTQIMFIFVTCFLTTRLFSKACGPECIFKDKHYKRMGLKDPIMAEYPMYISARCAIFTLVIMNSL